MDRDDRIIFKDLFILVIGKSLAQSPDRVLSFEREVPTKSRPDPFERLMSSVTRWPQWFYSLSKAKIINADGSSTLEKGSSIVLDIDPKKGARKRFQLTAEVTQYLPGQKLGLKITQDIIWPTDPPF